MKFYVLIGLAVFLIMIVGMGMSTQDTQEQQIVIGFAGDTMLGRTVNEAITEHGFAYPWGNMLPVLHSTDLNIINLETTLTKSNKIIPKVFNFKADPDKVRSLQEARIDIVNIANNHILDFNDEGLFETIAVLDAANIAHVGAGANIILAKKPVIMTRNGIKVGIIGYTDNEPDWLAKTDKPGINYVRVGDREAIVPDIIALRPHVDLLIVSCHWGPNKVEKPSQEFQDFAHALIDAGVDIIHGHSAHLVQGIERYKNKLIMFDTGDFVDDYAVYPDLRNDLSFFFLVTVKKLEEKAIIEEVRFVPVRIDTMQVNHARGDDREHIIQRMQRLSAELGTALPSRLFLY